jgi:acyl-CoA thioester hydrolase
MESARSAFLIDQGLIGSLADLRMILARVEIDFRSQLEFGETVDVEVRPAKLGTKSFELEYELRAGDRVVANARSVQVGFDYETGETIAIPEQWRKLLTPA